MKMLELLLKTVYSRGLEIISSTYTILGISIILWGIDLLKMKIHDAQQHSVFNALLIFH